MYTPQASSVCVDACICVCELVHARAFKCMLVFPLYTATAVRLHCCLVIRRVFLAALSNLLLLLVRPQTVWYYVNVRICGISNVRIKLYDSTLYLDTETCGITFLYRYISKLCPYQLQVLLVVTKFVYSVFTVSISYKLHLHEIKDIV